MKFTALAQAKKILIYGYGVEGQSTEKFLKSHFPDLQINIYDDNLPEFEFKEFEFYDLIICSPGIDRGKIKNGVESKITSQTELFFANITETERKKIIGITGTKGKSTTVQFCADLLTLAGKKVRIGGNFGVPPLDLWDDLRAGKIDRIIFEISSFQLEHLKASPHIALFLNLFGDHLDRHKTIENYFLAKANIFKYQTPEDFLIVPEVSGKLLEFSRGKGRFVLASPLSEDFFPKDSIFRALHFRQNLGTVKTLCDILKIPAKVLEKTAQKFKGLPHRMEFFAEKNGIRFVNDSIAVNPTAVMAAVQFFKDDLGSIILGGRSGGDSWETLLTLLRDQTSALILLPNGESFDEILRTAKMLHFPPQRILQAETLEEITDIALKNTPPKTVCLLSPGAKSFDRFKDYREKGKAFKRFVEQA